MAHKLKEKPISLAVQLNDVRIRYKDALIESEIRKSLLKLAISLKPSSNSIEYKIKIIYKIGESPKAWILNPPIEMVNGKYPHHIYDFDKEKHPRICIYYPNGQEWKKTMLLSKSFIPWVLTWLNTYEYWVITGEWNYDEIVGKKK